MSMQSYALTLFLPSRHGSTAVISAMRRDKETPPFPGGRIHGIFSLCVVCFCCFFSLSLFHEGFLFLAEAHPWPPYYMSQ